MTAKGVPAAILRKAESKLATASIDFNSHRFDDSVSRSYYAVFHALSAILSWKGMTFHSHSQTIGAFNKEFVKNGVFPKEFSSYIQSLFTDRQIGDYDTEISIDQETAARHLKNAGEIVMEIIKYLQATGAV